MGETLFLNWEVAGWRPCGAMCHYDYSTSRKVKENNVNLYIKKVA